MMKKKILIYKKLSDRIPALKKKRRAKVMYKFMTTNKQKYNKKIRPTPGSRLSI